MKLLFVFATLAIAGVWGISLPPQFRAAFSSGDIIDGTEAQKGEAPYIVSLKYFGSHFCAGTIIFDCWVLTAAHCLIDQNFVIVAGLHRRDDESDVQIRQVTSASQKISHELYDGGVGPNDIGLIRLAECFDLDNLTRSANSPVGSVSLPSGINGLLPNGTLYGWGLVRSGNLPIALQKLDTKNIGYDECRAALPPNAPIDPVNICTVSKGPNPYEGACNGDSGGPLVQVANDGTVEQVGIVSWGYSPCERSPYPSVYTSIARYLNWIADKMAQLNFQIKI